MVWRCRNDSTWEQAAEELERKVRELLYELPRQANASLPCGSEATAACLITPRCAVTACRKLVNRSVVRLFPFGVSALGNDSQGIDGNLCRTSSVHLPALFGYGGMRVGIHFR